MFQMSREPSFSLRVSSAYLLDTLQLKRVTNATIQKQEESVSRDVKVDEKKCFYEEMDWNKVKHLSSSHSNIASKLKFLLENLNLPNENRTEDIHPSLIPQF